MTSTEQKKCLDKILSSQEFSGSKIYDSYLTYLIEAKNAGKDLKETTIALEFFGKDATFNPAEDTIVRSHTYHLRKKLESYYHNEGREDKCRLKIPKGHYDVKFYTMSDAGSSAGTIFKSLTRKKYYLLTILLAGISLVFLLAQNQMLENQLSQYRIIDKADPIWGDYLQSDLPVLISVGDHFFYNDYSDENVLAIRDGRINSLDDLEIIKSKYPDKNFQPAEEPYFPYHSLWSLPPILSLFYSVNQKPILRKSSALSPQMLDEYNMIFLGSIKTLYILTHTLSKSHFHYEILPHKIIYTPSDSGTAQIFKTSLHSTGPNDDLVLAVKLPGPVNNSIFIIASFHSLGAPEITKQLAEATTRSALENKFREKFGEMPKYFEILFRVTGIDKTAYNTEILIFDEIPAE